MEVSPHQVASSEAPERHGEVDLNARKQDSLGTSLLVQPSFIDTGVRLVSFCLGLKRLKEANSVG